MDATLRALNRFGLGARPGDRAQVRNPKAWLREQLEGGPPRFSCRRQPRPRRHRGRDTSLASEAAGRPVQPAARRDGASSTSPLAESRAALTARVTSDRPFVERLVAFWSNHLCVSTGGKMLVAPLAGSYERDAIRPHVLGRFEDMVLASAKHPAMLAYLDNFQSIGPGSRGAQRGRTRPGGRARAERELRARAAGAAHARRRRRLHAAGRAGAGEDAHRLDGRRPRPPRRACPQGRQARGAAGRVRAPRFARRRSDPVRVSGALHEPGGKTLLGTRYQEDGRGEGRARHQRRCAAIPPRRASWPPSWSTHFVSDEPPAAAVDRVAKVFRDSGGDLRRCRRAR